MTALEFKNQLYSQYNGSSDRGNPYNYDNSCYKLLIGEELFILRLVYIEGSGNWRFSIDSEYNSLIAGIDSSIFYTKEDTAKKAIIQYLKQQIKNIKLILEKEEFIKS